MKGENDPNYPPPAAGGTETPPETPEGKEGFLSDGKPLRLSALEITELVDAVIFMPKGSTEAPELAAQERLSTVSAENAKLSLQVETLTKQVEELSKSKTELETKLQAIDDAKRLSLATELIDMRIEKGLMSKDTKEDAVKKLTVMSEEQLSTAVEDYKTLNTKKPDPAPKSGGEPATKPVGLETEGETDEKRQKRMAIFGHEDPIEAILKNDPGFAGDVNIPEVD